jgi:hypothetical protein
LTSMIGTGDKGMLVVLRFRNGRTERVSLVNIDSETEQVTGIGADQRNAAVSFGELKAVFFPHALQEAEIDSSPASTIAVEFSDGEVIRGRAHYNPEKNGFFLFPLDRSKNDKVFVVSSAISSIEVEKY